ncbi:hypothetical protein SAMN05428934_101337 [Tessaracoccus flavus]|nr:hypothetical protein SAMN05428934_101337 [Tessaracoccus flavus]
MISLTTWTVPRVTRRLVTTDKVRMLAMTANGNGYRNHEKLSMRTAPTAMNAPRSTSAPNPRRQALRRASFQLSTEPVWSNPRR